MKAIKTWKISVLAAAAILMLTLGVIGCADEAAEEEEDVELVFADAGWESIRVHNHIAAIILEEGYGGYQKETMSGSTPATFTELRRGGIDIYMEVWKENFLEEYNEAVEQGEIEVLSVNFDDNRQGLYVPTFVIEGDEERGIEPMAPDLESVFDLPEYWELFQDPEDSSKGRIVGSPSEWAVDEILEQKVETYELDEYYNYFRPGSEATLNTAIVDAYESGEPIIAYNWEPTWIMGKYDMTLLEEPEFDEETYYEEGYATEIPAMDVTVAVHSSMVEEHPEVVEFLSQYETSSEVTNEALAYMEEHNVDEREAAMWFLREYEDIWTQWVDEEVADNVRAVVSE